MKNQLNKIGILAITFSAILSSCNKEKDAPKPDEQELITTLKIQIKESTSTILQTFEYKVENGFSGTGGTIKIDTLKLKPNTTYDAVLMVLNEKKTPVEDITAEIIEKDYEHLFLFTSTPLTGNGSLETQSGNKDKNGAPLNQTFKLKTNSAGAGKFKIQLMHLPTDKNGTSADASGGETDLDATFPVLLQ